MLFMCVGATSVVYASEETAKREGPEALNSERLAKLLTEYPLTLLTLVPRSRLDAAYLEFCDGFYQDALNNAETISYVEPFAYAATPDDPALAHISQCRGTISGSDLAFCARSAVVVFRVGATLDEPICVEELGKEAERQWCQIYLWIIATDETV